MHADIRDDRQVAHKLFFEWYPLLSIETLALAVGAVWTNGVVNLSKELLMVEFTGPVPTVLVNCIAPIGRLPDVEASGTG